jgi:PST family polysaccharide transporter
VPDVHAKPLDGSRAVALSDPASAVMPSVSFDTPSGLPTSFVAGYGVRAAQGFSWMLLQTVFGKLAGIVTQVVLGRLLLQDDFALVGLAYVVTAFAGIVQDAGLSQVLIHRQRRFRQWSNIVAWMSLASGLCAAALIAGAAPVAARIYQEPRLVPLLLLLAAGAPLNTIGVVPGVLLQITMRFRFLAIAQFGFTLLTASLTILMATLDCGPYAIVVPPMLTAVVRGVIYWSVARPPLRYHPDFGRWRYVLGDSALILASAFFVTVTMQADNLVLGLLATKDVLGAYYFGFNLSMQTTLLITATLTSVLFPVLSKLQHEPQRQCAAFLQAARIVALVGVPACVLQASVADPIMRAVFGTKWLAAIPIVQILSVGSALQLVNAPAMSLIQAQGRFKIMFRLTVLLSMLFLMLVIVGAMAGGAIGVAVAATVAAGVGGLLVPTIAIRPAGRSVWDVLTLYVSPVAVAAAAACTAIILVGFVPTEKLSGRLGHAVQATLVAVSFGSFYVVVMCRIRAEDVADLWRRVIGLRQRAGRR